MGKMTDGIQPQLDTTGIVDTDGLFDLLLSAIPDPDTPNDGHTGAIQGIMGWLDEMSPLTAAQLRVEITALKTFANNATVPGV